MCDSIVKLAWKANLHIQKDLLQALPIIPTMVE